MQLQEKKIWIGKDVQQSWNSLAKWSLDNGKIISVSTVCNCNSVKRCAEFIRSLCECRKGERVVLRCPRPYASRVKHTLCAFLFVWEGDLTFQWMRCSHFLPADWAAVVSLTLLVNLSPSPARRARASVVCVWEEEKDRLCVCSMCAGRPQVSAHGVRVLRGLPRGPWLSSSVSGGEVCKGYQHIPLRHGGAVADKQVPVLTATRHAWTPDSHCTLFYINA